MVNRTRRRVDRACWTAALLLAWPPFAAASERIEAAGPVPTLDRLDVFELEVATDPQLSPDGRRVAYVRRSMDIMTDRAVGSLWIVDVDGGDHRPLVADTGSHGSPRFSPDGTRLAWVTAAGSRGAEIHVRWLDTGQTALISNLPTAPANLAWSPDGAMIAFTMLVPQPAPPLASPPQRPEGAEWAEPVQVIDRVTYRFDGAGYLQRGHAHLFVIPATGGTPRQLTRGDFQHGGALSWSPDGRYIAFAATREDDWERRFRENEIWRVDVSSGELTRLTDFPGPANAPAWSPDGRHIAFRGFADARLSFQPQQLQLLDTRSGEVRSLTGELDRNVGDFAWRSADELVIRHDDQGRRHLASIDLEGHLTPLTDAVGGTGIGRPYTSGDFSSARDGTIAFTLGSPERPADVAVLSRGRVTRLTDLNEDLLAHRRLGRVEAVRWPSSVGDHEIQGWLVTPPDFDPSRQYPLLLEIHGGPHTAYGPHFSAEVQLYAAAGYVVLYANPRGSTSYGAGFANEIHHDYPGRDYDDLMSGVDAVLARGFVDPRQLFVTGGSGGGVLTAWIVGKTDRFAAAVSAKPVINWVSFALTADIGLRVTDGTWFERWPWETPEHYWARSPLSLVGNVSTPTMLLTGEQDHRTPITESEQYYQALQARGVDTLLVRVPGASHSIYARPSQLIAKVDNILAWFARYRTDTTSPSDPDRNGD